MFCVLAILPMVGVCATGDIVDVAEPESAADAGQSPDAVTAKTYSKYALATQGDADGNLASTAYVKGAYNATIKTVNKLQDVKQDKLSSENVVESGVGAMVMDVSAENGTVTVTKSEVTIPVGATTSVTRATIWLE